MTEIDSIEEIYNRRKSSARSNIREGVNKTLETAWEYLMAAQNYDFVEGEPVEYNNEEYNVVNRLLGKDYMIEKEDNRVTVHEDELK